MAAVRAARPSIPTATSRSHVNSASPSLRFEHALVVPAHDLGVAAVRDEGEPVAAERERALVVLHRRRDDALGKAQEALVEGTCLHPHALDEIDDLLEHVLRVAPPAELVQALDDLPVPGGAVRLDSDAAKHLRVLLRRRHIDRAGSREPMAVRDAARRDPFDVHAHRLVAELCAEPAHGARESEVRAPAHGASEPKLCDDRGEPLREHLDDGPTRHRDAEEAVAYLELLRGDAVTPREPCGSALSQVLRRPLQPLVGRSPGKLVDEERESARTEIEVARPRREVAQREVRELNARLAAGGRRQLLGPDLKQERRHRPPAPGRAERRRARGCGRGRYTRPAR